MFALLQDGFRSICLRTDTVCGFIIDAPSEKQKGTFRLRILTDPPIEHATLFFDTEAEAEAAVKDGLPDLYSDLESSISDKLK